MGAVVLLSLLLLGDVPAQNVVLTPQQRVENLDPGCCTWASIEMQGRFLGIRSLTGLTRDRQKQAEEWIALADGSKQQRQDSGGTVERIEEELKKRKVAFRIQKEGDFSFSLIDSAVKSRRPVSVSLRDYPEDGTFHAVLLIDINDKTVRFIDSNSPSRDVHKSRAWFNKHWIGRVVSIDAPPRSTPIVSQFPSTRQFLYVPPGVDADAFRDVLAAGPVACRTYLRDRLGFSSDEADSFVRRFWPSLSGAR